MEQGKILEGIKVLDLTRIYTGPFCTQILADLGADICKIEDVGPISNERTWPPFALDSYESTYFLAHNRGKKSIELNFKENKAKEIFFKLLVDADIVIENFAPGVVSKLGISYEDCKKVKPDIIYLSISAFGQYGPLSKNPGYDMLAQAMGGMMAITGTPEQPYRVGSSLGDVLAGMYGCIGVLAALQHRNTTGKGEYIDIALVDSVFACLEDAISSYLIANRPPNRYGNRHPNGGPYDAYPAKDGYVAMVASNEKLFGSLCKAMGMPELHSNPKFRDNPARAANVDELSAIIKDWMKKHTVEEALDILTKERVAAAPVLEIPQIVEHEHIKARHMLLEYDHPTAGHITIPGQPIKLSSYEAVADIPPPYKGQHAKEILIELRYSEDEIMQMVEQGAVGDGFIKGKSYLYD